MILSHIAALSRNRVIGREGDLPWDLPEDMAYFRAKTKGHILIMGRKTFESFPKPLKDRLHIVVTREPAYRTPEGVLVVPTIEAAINLAESKVGTWPDEVFIIGGGEIYRQTLEMADRLYLTEIDQEVAGDTLYPELPANSFILADRDERFTPLAFAFCLYVKKVDI
jgi:dihydrofolate reductase